MVSYQAHNLSKRVRFPSLLMNINVYEISILLILILLILDYSTPRSNLLSIFFIVILSGLIVMIKKDFWNLPLFELNSWKIMFLVLILISFFIILQLSENENFDTNCLLFLTLLGSIILVSSDNLLILYLGLELQTFSIFILIAKNRDSIKSSEAGLKYFMLGAISSGFFLLSFSILFLYGLDLNLKHLLLLKDDYMVYISFFLITISFCFKISLFPFHFWIPDIYEGSSWNIVTLVATLPKISMVCIIGQILYNSNIILAFSLLSIAIGTLGALNQTKIKRLLAYSGISHMGFIILGLSLISNESFCISILYLIIYMVNMISLFIIIITNNHKNQFIIEWSAVKSVNNIISITFILIILSIAGIPPLSGFISKWYLIWIIMDNHFILSSFVAVTFSAIGLGYYLRLVKITYFQKKSSYFIWENILRIEEEKNKFSFMLLGFLSFFNVFIIINFSSLINYLNNALLHLF